MKCSATPGHGHKKEGQTHSTLLFLVSMTRCCAYTWSQFKKAWSSERAPLGCATNDIVSIVNVECIHPWHYNSCTSVARAWFLISCAVHQWFLYSMYHCVMRSSGLGMHNLLPSMTSEIGLGGHVLGKLVHWCTTPIHCLATSVQCRESYR